MLARRAVLGFEADQTRLAGDDAGAQLGDRLRVQPLFGAARLAQAVERLPGFVEGAAQGGILRACGVERRPVSARGVADLVLDHVDVAEDVLLEALVAGRMGPGGPHRAGNLQPVEHRVAPQREDAGAAPRLGKAAELRRVTFFQAALQGLGERRPAGAGADRANVEFVVAARRRQAQHLDDPGAQFFDREADADDRAVELGRQLPEPAALGAGALGAGAFFLARLGGAERLAQGQHAGLSVAGQSGQRGER